MLLYRVALVQVCKHFLREGRVLRVFTLYVDVHVSLFRKEEGAGLMKSSNTGTNKAKGEKLKFKHV